MKRCVPVLTIAGSDSSGGAGIEADIKTIAALGGYAAAAITAVTAQNTTGVMGIEVISPNMVAAQIDAVMTDIAPRAVKIGMTGNRDIATAIAHSLCHYAVPVVVDPVMVSTSGFSLTENKAGEVPLSPLLPMATLLTPNIPEAEKLAGHAITSDEQRMEAAAKMLGMGCGAVLIKGGHALAAQTATDWLYAKEPDGTVQTHRFDHPRIVTNNTHGTGCTLSSAIATYMAMGFPLIDAVEKGIQYLHRALDAGAHIAIGRGFGPVNHGFAPLPLLVK